MIGSGFGVGVGGRGVVGRVGVLLVLLLVGVCVFGAVGASGEVFGVEGFGGFLGNGPGAPVVGGGFLPQAGSHPSALTTTFTFNHRVVEEKEEIPGKEPFPIEVVTTGSPKNVTVNLPPGMVVDPQATPRCMEAQLDANTCPVSSAVGVVVTQVAGNTFPFLVVGALYNMVAPAGSPGQFAANLVGLGFVVHINGKVRGGSYALSAEATEIIQTFPVYRVSVTLWGDPSNPDHDLERGRCLESPGESCPDFEPSETALLTLGGSCTGQPQVMSSVVESWGAPDVPVPALSSWPAVTGCGGLQFEPAIEVKPERSGTGLASGVSVDLKMPQDESLNALGAANLKEAEVTLPEGMGINPAAAGGRTACSPSQVGLQGPEEKQSVAVETPIADTFKLAIDGQETGAIGAGADTETVQLALEGLPAIGAGGVSVTTVSGGYEVAFPGRELPALTGESVDDDFQVLDVQGEGGTFKLSFEGHETGSLPYYAHAKEVQQALETADPELKGSVKVSGGGLNSLFTDERAPYTVAFTGKLADKDVPEPIAVISSLTGEGAGGTVTNYPPQSVPLAIGVEGSGVHFAEKVENPQTGQPEATACPQASKIGTVEVTTPLLGHSLPGSVYLAEQEHNPFGSLFAIYLVVDDPATGVIVKLAGEVEPDEATGQVTSKFVENPQLPVEDIKVDLFGGQRAPLVTPASCGPATTNAQLTPWSTGKAVSASSTFNFGENEPCPPAGFKPSLFAGATSAQAAASSTFVMGVSRGEHEQYFHRVSVTLAPGLLATLNGVPRCGETEANAGTCPAASQIGEASAAVGVGEPYWVTGGKIYLTGPYEGDPFGLSIAVPAVAGPFNLGTQVVRAGIQINPATAQPTVTTSPTGAYAIPAILKGVPLYIREIRASINRPGFMVNPTNCATLETTGTITATPAVTSTSETSAPVSAPYQAANCATLPFKPALTASTQAKTTKTGGASLTVKLSFPHPGPQSGNQSGEANIRSVHVELPKALPSRLTTLQKACTEKVFEANPASCPAESIVGHAKAITPILPVPLEGPAYFVSHGGAAFPELILILQGYGITIQLNGKTDIKHGVTSSTFATVPDAPVNTFELVLPQGKYSALAANGNLCQQKLVMPTAFVGQNGATLNQDTHIEVEGCSNTLSLVSKSIHKQTLKLVVYAPASGKLTASGKGVSSHTKSYSGQEALTFTLRQKKAGKLSTKIKLIFTPKSGKKLSKSLTVKFKQ